MENSMGFLAFFIKKTIHFSKILVKYEPHTKHVFYILWFWTIMKAHVI